MEKGKLSFAPKLAHEKKSNILSKAQPICNSMRLETHSRLMNSYLFSKISPKNEFHLPSEKKDW